MNPAHILHLWAVLGVLVILALLFAAGLLLIRHGKSGAQWLVEGLVPQGSMPSAEDTATPGPQPSTQDVVSRASVPTCEDEVSPASVPTAEDAAPPGSGPSFVTIENSGNSFRYLVNGNPQVFIGMGYNPIY